MKGLLWLRLCYGRKNLIEIILNTNKKKIQVNQLIKEKIQVNQLNWDIFSLPGKDGNRQGQREQVGEHLAGHMWAPPGFHPSWRSEGFYI